MKWCEVFKCYTDDVDFRKEQIEFCDKSCNKCEYCVEVEVKDEQ